DLVFFKQVMDDPAQKDDIGAGTDGRIQIRHRGRSGKAGVDHDEFGAVVRLGFRDPLESAGMRFGGSAAHDQYDIRVFDVDPMVRHRSTAKRRGKTCHRRAMSETGLVVECKYAEAAYDLVRDVADLVGAGGCGQHACGQPAVDDLAVCGALLEVGVAVVLHETRDTTQGFIPGHALPGVGAGGAVFGVLEAAGAVDEIDQRSALRTERTAIDGMVGIAFDVHDAGNGVFGAVAGSVHQYATGHGTIGTG